MNTDDNTDDDTDDLSFEDHEAGDDSGESGRNASVSPREPSQPSQRGWPTIVMCVGVAVAVAYMVVLPVATTLIGSNRPAQASDWGEMSAAENVRLRTAELFGVVWFFAFGASLGSFLNVVAGRMPQRKSIGGSSHCPNCDARLGRWDNVPIVGWLRLRGRCRTCRAEISSRYLIVEAIMGGLFVLFLFVELLTGCGNVPLTRHYAYDGFVWIVFFPKWEVYGMYAYHMALLCWLLVVSLVAWDGARIPKRLTAFGTVLGGVLPVIWSHLHAVPWLTSSRGRLPDWRWLDPIATTLAGVTVGACVGAMLGSAWQSAHRSGWRQTEIGTPAVASMILVGTFLGWQAALSVGAIACLLPICLSVIPLRRTRFSAFPLAGWIMAATVIQLCLWSTAARWKYWPGPHSSATTFLGALVGLLVGRRVLRGLRALSADNHAAVTVEKRQRDLKVARSEGGVIR